MTVNASDHLRSSIAGFGSSAICASRELFSEASSQEARILHYNMVV